MKHTDQERYIALSALFQACDCVASLARTGKVNQSAMECLVNSIFKRDADSTLAIYESIEDLNIGIKTLEKYFSRVHSAAELEKQHYAMSILLLAKKLAKKPALLDDLAQRIERCTRQKDHYHSTHPSVIANLADTYVNTVGTFALRIQIKGDTRHLTSNNIEKIRVLLLAGVRAAILWRQLGGGISQLLFFRKRTARQLKALLNTLA